MFKNLRVEVDLQDILKRILLLLILFMIGGVIQVITSWASDGDWFGINEMIYKHGVIEKGKEVKIYSVGEFIFYFGQVVGNLLWTLGIRKLVSIFRLGRYTTTWFIDLIGVCLWFVVFENAKLHHTTQTYMVLASTTIFIGQLILDLIYPPFRKFKLF